MKGRPTKLHLHAVEHFHRGAIAAAHLADDYNAGSCTRIASAIDPRKTEHSQDETAQVAT